MMMSEAAKALGGELIGKDTLFTAVSKDTRSIAAGDLYIAIKGDQYDGHAFVQQAGEAGAAGALVSYVEGSTMEPLAAAEACFRPKTVLACVVMRRRTASPRTR